MTRDYFPLAPRYRLDDESPWLQGIDPSRRYWIDVNSSPTHRVSVEGLVVADFDEFKQTILGFRSLANGEQMQVERICNALTIHCLGENCYAIEGEVAGAPVWHLFDRESLESLLMTAHPDWQCAPKDVDLGRRMLMRSWESAIAA